MATRVTRRFGCESHRKITFDCFVYWMDFTRFGAMVQTVVSSTAYSTGFGNLLLLGGMTRLGIQEVIFAEVNL